MERDRNDGIPFRDPVDGENRKALSFYSLASFPAEQSRLGGCPRYGWARRNENRSLMRQSDKYKVVPRKDAPFRIDF